MQEYNDFTDDIDNDHVAGYGNNFLFFLKSYLINPLAISKAMKNKANRKLSFLVGIAHILSSVLLFLGLCLNCQSVVKDLYGGNIYTPFSTAILFGLLFAVITTFFFIGIVYLVSLTKDAKRPKIGEVLAVFNANTIWLSFFYILCFTFSFVSFYVTAFILLLALFYFTIVCTFAIEALTDAVIFGRKALFIGSVVSVMLTCMVALFIVLLCVLYASFAINGEHLKEAFYTLLRYLR